MERWQRYQPGSLAGRRAGHSVASVATGINNAGQAVGFSDGKAVEWNAGRINDLGALPGFTASFAQNINNTGQVVGYSDGPLQGSVIAQATKWSNGSVINLGGLPGSTDCRAYDAQAVGESVTAYARGNGITT